MQRYIRFLLYRDGRKGAPQVAFEISLIVERSFLPSLFPFSFWVSHFPHDGPSITGKDGPHFPLSKAALIMVKCVSNVLGKLSDSRTSYISSVTIVQRAG